jgi:hypothetical protein
MSKQKIIIALILVLGLSYCANAELVGWWRLDETEGTVAWDSSGNELHGKVTGGTTWIPNGRFGGALEFDGVGTAGTNVTLPISQLLNGLTNSTFAIWANFHQTGGAWQRLWDFGDGTANGYMFLCPRIGTTETGTLRYASTLTSNGNEQQLNAPFTLPTDWHHVTIVLNKDEGNMIMYVDGEVIDEKPTTIFPANLPLTTQNWLGQSQWPDGIYEGALDDFRIYDQALTQDEIAIVMTGAGAEYPFAFGPNPANGALHADTWVTLSWKAGDFAACHDIYLGDNFDDVNNATHDSELFRGNQDLNSTFYVAGFPGFAYPDGLVNGTTYYWRIDEVNDANTASPWKGPVWSFTIPPKTAYSPVPADGAEFVVLNVQLKWTPGYGAKLHFVFFGDDFDEVSNAVIGKLNGTTTYNPGPLELAKTYYWRVDESDGSNTYKGEVWSFTTEGAVSGPNPETGGVDVKPTQILTWDAGAVAASHEVYFGMDADAVKNATKDSPEYKGPKALGEESYNPGKLTLNTTYYWRIDEVNDASPDSPWQGNVWSFTTGDYFVIDDFEDYDAGENQIWYSWHDGLGYGAPGTADYYAGNGTGAAVGDETTASYTEETIVHGGNQSMPIAYDNNKQGFSKYSEVDYTVTNQRDWTEEGVANLSIWFRGYPAPVGSFVEGPTGTFTMTASGADIWNVNGVEADEFHFAYKMLTGAGSIVAKVVSVSNTNGWAKAGVMIRESLNPDSAHAFACVTPSNGVASQGRPSTGGVSFSTNQTGIIAPYWVKLERSISGNFTVSHSANGTTWQPVTGAIAQNIPMGSNVYIGLAVTAHDPALTCQAVFSNVTTTGNVTGQWVHQDIGILSNAAEPLYVAVSNSTGNPAVVVQDDPTAAQIDTWTEWVIPLSAFADQGIILTNVDRITLGLGTRGNTTAAGGSGKMFFDDIRLIK